MFNYLDTVEIAKDCKMIIGRDLSFAKKEADIGNTIVYKKNDVLYIIDTGAVLDFRNVMLETCKSMLPVKKIILVNTHGHCDHVANNIIIEQLEAPEKKHYISVHDLEMMKNNQEYFVRNFKKVTPFISNAPNPDDQVRALLAFFNPLDVTTKHLKTLETLSSENIRIGNINWSGWKLDDACYVLRTEGHTKGHVILYFPDILHMHMGDEINGYCNLFHDCDNLKSLESHTKLISMLNEGTVKTMSASHDFDLFNNERAKEKMAALLNAHYVYEQVLRDLLIAHPKGLTFAEIKQHLDNSEQIKNLSKLANPNPVFSVLMILSKFRDLGIIADRDDLTNALFQFQAL